MNYDPTDPDKMRLQPGTTCGDCVHIDRCKAIFGHVEADTYCDWSPSLFRQRPVAAIAPPILTVVQAPQPRECGECKLWMTAQCPRERLNKLTGRWTGPTSRDIGCDKWDSRIVRRPMAGPR